MKTKLINVLYFDEEVQNLYAFKASFRRFFNISLARSEKEAAQILRENQIHVFVSDQHDSEVIVTDFIKNCCVDFPDLINIVVSGYVRNEELVTKTLAEGDIFKFLPKPWDENEFRLSIEEAYEVHSFLLHKKQEIEVLKSQISDSQSVEDAMMSLVNEDIKDSYVLKHYLQYVSDSITNLKEKLAMVVRPDILIENR